MSGTEPHANVVDRRGASQAVFEARVAKIEAAEADEESWTAKRMAAYNEGRWCGECIYGVVMDPPCCTQPDLDPLTALLDKWDAEADAVIDRPTMPPVRESTEWVRTEHARQMKAAAAAVRDALGGAV